ncbi:hypothetical protein AHIS1_p069 [Acaryochloris phage A-HIS1]|nr:hypothetical protein AHIS1_p069 [Acaryochloris phage A-HIS1]
MRLPFVFRRVYLEYRFKEMLMNPYEIVPTAATNTVTITISSYDLTVFNAEVARYQRLGYTQSCELIVTPIDNGNVVYTQQFSQ